MSTDSVNMAAAEEAPPSVGSMKVVMEDYKQQFADMQSAMKDYDSRLQSYSLEFEFMQRKFFEDYMSQVEEIVDEDALPRDFQETSSSISLLELEISNLHLSFVGKSVGIVKEQKKQVDNIDNLQSDAYLLPKQDKACMSALKTRWTRIRRMLYCMDTHMRNAAEYQQFFHESIEYERHLKAGIAGLVKDFNEAELKANSYKPRDLDITLNMINSTMSAFRQWETKVNDLVARSKQVVPLQLRHQPLEGTDTKPIKALCTLRTPGVTIVEGERLLLIDNKQKHTWKVANSLGKVAFVPALCCQIPPPDSDALQGMMRLRLQLLAAWTNCIRYMGIRILWLVTDLQKQQSGNREYWRVLSAANKKTIIEIVAYLEKTLGVYWSTYDGYKSMLVTISEIRTLISQSSESGKEDPEMVNCIVPQTKQMEVIVKKYQEFWSMWEIYKILVQTSSDSRYMLMVEKWDQLRMTSTTHFLNYWHSELTKDDMNRIEEEAKLEMKVSKERVVTEKSEYTEASHEVKQSFTIRAVLDPRTNKEITMDQAVREGIIDQNKGVYVHPITKKELPIPNAMNEGLILVSASKTQKSAEQQQSVGIISITLTKETSPYTVLGVIDPRTGEQLSVNDAIVRGLYNEADRIFQNPETNEKVGIEEAIDLGVLVVEIDKNNITAPEVLTKTYAVYAAEDLKENKRLSYQEAVERGIININTEEFLDTRSGEPVPLADAYEKGWVKAMVVDEHGNPIEEPEAEVPQIETYDA